MTAVELLAPGERTLNELAADANREHDLVIETGSAMVEHAIRAGEALIKAKESCEPTAWTMWLADHWHAARVTALVYMRLARHQDEIREAGATSVITARRHLTMIEAPAAASRYGWRNPPDWVTQEARELRAQGLSIAEVARRVGAPYTTVRTWVNPGVLEAQRRAALERRALRRELREREKLALTRKAARKAGGAEAELYAMAERMQDVIGRAHREATNPEKRRYYSVAGEHYRKMRDEIVRALGVA